MRVLIGEAVPDGHRLYFVRLVAVAAFARGDEVSFCTSTAVLESREFTATLGGLPLTIIREDAPTAPSVLVRVSKQTGSDVTVVLDADRMITRLATRARWSGSGVLRLLMLRSRMPHRGADRLHRARVATKKVLIARVAAMRRVEVLHLVPSSSDGRYAPGEVGDPVEWSVTPAALASWRARLDPGIFWFAVVGVVTERKNVPLVLAVLQDLQARGHSVGLVVAGRIDTDVRVLLDDARAASALPIEVEDRLLDEEELDAAVSAVECVVLAHSNEGSSGIFGKASMSGTRVLAAGALTLQDACRSRPAGAIWSPLTFSGVSEAAARLLHEPPPAVQALRSNLTERLLSR